MPLGVYVHIPYCVQRCHYCDFTTFEQSKIMPPQKYVELLLSEIQSKSQFFESKTLTSLYFGGGTPSLIPAELIVAIIEELAKHGFNLGPGTETTIEINPYTIDERKLDIYQKAGINRFSVGAQTFKDSLLKKIGREHNSAQTRETLSLLKARKVNFNFDILFALPDQTLSDLVNDMEIAIDFNASHISPYCLTIPEGHPLSKGRPVEDDQISMFDEIQNHLLKAGYHQYEISNYARPHLESRHNMLYWTDENYWGLGLSAHSYVKGRGFACCENENVASSSKLDLAESSWGLRFWNTKQLDEYENQILELEQNGPKNGHSGAGPQNCLPSSQIDELNLYSALTDFCHTSLRISAGLKLDALNLKFSVDIVKKLVLPTLTQLTQRSLLKENSPGVWSLTGEGQMISNQVFEKLTFLAK